MKGPPPEKKEKTGHQGKLMKLFSRQLATKIKHSNVLSKLTEQSSQYPNLAQFLNVVSIDPDVAEEMAGSCKTIEEACLLSDDRIRHFFPTPSEGDDPFLSYDHTEEANRLVAALKILRHYTERLKNGEKASDLVWESWYDTLPEPLSVDSRSSIASYLSVFSSTSEEVTSPQTKSLSLPYSSRLESRSIPPSPTFPQKIPVSITRSKSDEANLGRRIHTDSCSSAGSVSGIGSRKSARYRPHPLNLTVTNVNGTELAQTDSELSKSRSSSISQSPRTPTRLFHFGMGHSIKHRFSAKTFLISLTCDYCHRIMFVGVRCKDCGFKCHKKCSRKAPPSCGLPAKLEKVFMDTIQHDGASDSGLGQSLKFYTLPNMKRTVSDPSNIVLRVDRDIGTQSMNRSHGDLLVPSIDHRKPYYPPSVSDECSTSSTSSVPSSPALNAEPSPVGTPLKYQHGLSYYITDHHEEMFFPDDNTSRDELIRSQAETETSTLIGTVKSDLSIDTLTRTEESSQSKTSSGTKSTESESTISGNEDINVSNLDLQISGVASQHVKLRDVPLSKDEKLDMLMNLHERGSLMSEWVIPFQDIEIIELIGRGRMGEVYKAKWHGEVAMKMLHLENPTEEEKNAFKYKVQTFRKTRHENLVLFMGACMDPPTLAIVTSLCKGPTLYQYIHIRKETLEDNKMISIIQQVAQSMSYLHARGICHKDLKSKNVFIEKNRAVVTDFGLLTVGDNRPQPERLGWVTIPCHWLCYQAPEIVRALDPFRPGAEMNLYSKETDIYAFGTLWYELLSGTWPFQDQSTEATIWQIGKGFKQSLSKLEVSRDVKDILSMCWAYDPANRPPFHMLLKAFDRLPKKKLIRSPSQPMYNIPRSADALILF